MSAHPPAAPEAAEAAPPKSKKMFQLMAVGFMVMVIGAECVVALMYLSSGGPAAVAQDEHKEAADEGGEGHDDADKADAHDEDAHHEDAGHEEKHAPAEEHGGHGKKGHGEEKKDAGHGGGGGHGGHGAPAAGAASVSSDEVDLGKFTLTAFQPASSTTLLVDFQLYAIVKPGTASQVAGLYEKHKHRIRDNIIITIRSADMEDLADPGLGLIKRRILEKVNTALGKKLVKEVVVSEFTFIEQ